MAKRDYYEVLGLSRQATNEDIKRAFRRLAKKLHPDRNEGDKGAEQRFKETQEAYAVLSDKEKRARYDRFGHDGVDANAGPRGATSTWSPRDGRPIDLGDLADMFDFSFDQRGSPKGSGFGGASPIFDAFTGQGGARTGSRRKAQDVEYPATLTFEQAVHGATLDLEVRAGSGRQRISVHIPPGVRGGQKIRVRGKGGSARGRKSPGDLYVVCNIQPHAYFMRDGDDIYLSLPITLTEAALGAKVDLPTIDGIRTVTIPPGTPSGTKLRLAGLGTRNPKGQRRGDQYAVIKIVPPKDVSSKQRDLLREFSAGETANPRDGLW